MSLEQQVQQAENEALHLEVQRHLGTQNALLTKLT